MAGHASNGKDEGNIEYDTWYRYGVFLLYVEMVIAIFVTCYSLYMAFTGSGGISH
jgi:hypothetical protein